MVESWQWPDEIPVAEATVAALEVHRDAIPDGVPDDVRQAAVHIAEAVIPAISTRNPVAFEDAVLAEDFFPTADVVDAYFEHACGWDVLPVVMDDYSFDADWDRLAPGHVGFALDNVGSELHHFVLHRINDDVDESAEEILAKPWHQIEAKSSFVVLSRPAGPGDGASRTYAALERGRYAAFCALRLGARLDDPFAPGRPHFIEGMVSEFEVA